MTNKEAYILQWQTDFDRHVSWAWNYAGAVLNNPKATPDDKKCFTSVLSILSSNEVVEIKRDLAEAEITLDTFDKIEKLNKDLLDAAIDDINVTEQAKCFFKGITHTWVSMAKSFGIQEARRMGVVV